jgi:hypothetical protein
MNNRRKGNDKELKAIKDLQSNGWTAGRVTNNSRFAKEHDLFGLFDIIAVRERVLFLQVTHQGSRHPHLKYIAFLKYHPVPKDSISVEQWAWVPRKGWNKYVYKQHEIRLYRYDGVVKVYNLLEDSADLE